MMNRSGDDLDGKVPGMQYRHYREQPFLLLVRPVRYAAGGVRNKDGRWLQSPIDVPEAGKPSFRRIGDLSG